MDVALLENKLQSLVDAQKVFTLASSVFPSLAPFGAVISGGQFVIDGAQVTTSAQGVTISGQSSALSFTDVALEADFLPGSDDQPVLTLKITPAPISLGTATLSFPNGLSLNAQSVSTGTLTGTAQIGTLQFTIAITRATGGEWTFTGTLNGGQNASLSTLAGLCLPAGQHFPDEVPDLQLEHLALTFSPFTKAFSLDGSVSSSWTLPFGVNNLAVSSLDFSFERGASTDPKTPADLSVKLDLKGSGPVTIVDDFVWQSFALSYTYTAASTWTLAGNVAAIVFNVNCALAATLVETPALRTITLTGTNTANPLVNVGGIAEITCSTVTVAIQKALTAGTKTGAQLHPDSAYSWSMTATGGLVIPEVLTADGDLVIHQDQKSTGLAFKPSSAQLTIAMPAPLNAVHTYIGMDALSIVHKTDATPASWVIDAGVDVWFDGLGATAESFLPIAAKPCTGNLKIEDGAVQVEVAHLVPRQNIPLPHTKVGSIDLNLGQAAIDIPDFALTIGKDISFTAQLGFGIPANANYMFGTAKDGSPSVSFFNVYDGTDPTVTQFAIELDSKKGLSIRPVTSPIKAIVFDGSGDQTYCNADLGEFGAVRFQVPTFSTNGDAFTGSGSFQVVRPLSLPLTPLKLLLDACGLSIIGDKLPHGLPLKGVELYDTQAQTFNFEAFIKTLEDLGGITIDQTTHDVLHAMVNQLDKLPDSFKAYLDITIPQDFSFDLTVTATGSFTGHIKFDDANPLKFMYPTIGVLGPAFTGIALRGFSIGEVLDGSLGVLTIDCDIDNFSLLTLIAALALPLDKLPVLPDTRLLQNHIVIRNLYMLVVYESPIPIPIPLFFDELAYEYLGLPGLQLQTHWSFPKPHLDPSAIVRLLTDFEQFVTDRSHLLDASKAPNGLDLVLTIGPNFIQLPAYLGGKMLGSKDTKIVVSAYEQLAHLMNAIKTLSLNEMIQAIALDKRVGTETVTFGPMSIGITWLLTTPDEFKAGAYKKINIPDSALQTALQVIPASPSQINQGLVVYLRGTWAIANAAGLDVSFGLVGTSRGFGTYFQLQGGISNVINANIGGLVVIDSGSEPHFRLNGHSALTLLNRPIFTGDVQIDDTHFRLTGALSLLPAASPLQINGTGLMQIDKSGSFLLAINVAVTLQNFVLAGAMINLSNSGIILSGSYLGRSVTFSLIVHGSDWTLAGSVAFNFALNISIGPIYEPITHVKVIDSLALSTALNAEFDMSLGSFGFSAGIKADFQWNSYHLTVPGFSISISPKDIASATGMIADQIHKSADAIFAEVFHLMTDWLKAGMNGVVQLSGTLESAAMAAKHWSQEAWNATAKWSTAAWQAASTWNVNAWNATTQWSTAAWNATATWSNDAWNATTHWSDDAWNATTKWTDDAWNTTTRWGTSAWQATATWGSDTWRATTTWTKDVWNNSLNWTTAQWNNVTATVANYLKSLIPHVDSTIPHADAITIPHGDTATPHVDSGKLHVDAASTHGDGTTIPHGDSNSPHADATTIPHGDSGSHADSGHGFWHWDTNAHWDTPSAHGDIGSIHADIPSAHGDIGTPHIDTPSTHVDTSGVHIDTSSVHIDTAAKHVDTP